PHYNSTLQCLTGNTQGCAVADPSDPNGPHWAFPAIDMQNSIVWNESGTMAYLRNREGTVTAVSVVTPSGCCTNNQVTGGDGSGWALNAAASYGGANKNL